MINGTVLVQSVIAPSREGDNYATHEARWGRGGYRTVEDIAERNAIPTRRREAGMLVFVEEDGITYMLDHDLVTWLDFRLVLANLVRPHMPPPPPDGDDPPDAGFCLQCGINLTGATICGETGSSGSLSVSDCPNGLPILN